MTEKNGLDCKMKIYLDDIRDPYDDTWTLVRSYDEFVLRVFTTVALSAEDPITHLSLDPITHISFDHDLGMDGEVEALSGMDAAKFFVEKCLDDPALAENLQEVIVHSANPAGVQNIAGLFKSASKHGVLNQNLIIKL